MRGFFGLGNYCHSQLCTIHLEAYVICVLMRGKDDMMVMRNAQMPISRFASTPALR